MLSFPPITFTNTFTGQKEIFQPLEDKTVRMYVCGITPYDECHLGHARCAIFFDIVRRFFSHVGYTVTHVQNFTDVDDKIIERAFQNKESCEALSARFIEDYFLRMDALNVLRASSYPKVTQNIPEIVRFIQNLVEKGMAYPLDGDVYYSVRKFLEYGKLSKRNWDQMLSGARVEVDARKKDPLDFALWKKSKNNEPGWPSPWGLGRPGWHIECSVMSMKHLGETFDIHGGGQDLIFPHHENEIAQSQGLTGKIFARYWMHNGFVTVNREKMSKSLGNFFTLREILEVFKAPVVRLFLLSRHYKSPLDFSDDLLKQSESAYRSLKETMDRVGFILNGDILEGTVLQDWEEKLVQELCDDFNTEKALAVVFNLRKEMNEKINERDGAWLKNAVKTMDLFCNKILGIQLKSHFDKQSKVQFVKQKLEERENFRKLKNWAQADSVRDQLKESGYVIEDTPLGVVVSTTSLEFN